jgi:hypothetical protein
LLTTRLQRLYIARMRRQLKLVCHKSS